MNTEQKEVSAMTYQDRISIEPGKRGGKPCIRGMRITVYDVLVEGELDQVIQPLVSEYHADQLAAISE